jgi:beta-glucuronidase
MRKVFKFWTRGVLVFLTGAASVSAPLRAATTIDLDGKGWTFHGTLDETTHEVSVPHCWPVMKGYETHIGDAVYERNFEGISVGQGKTARLHFDAVYYKAHVWLNGQDLGNHEGGYTPFEFDVTKVLKAGTNHLVVEVDNTPTLTTIPAIATAGHGGTSPPPYGTLNGEGIVGWMPYGGIVRPVSVIVTDSVYLKNIKIDAKPNLEARTARLTVHAWVKNAGAKDAMAEVSGTVAGVAVKFARVRISPNGEAELTWTGTLREPHLWSTRDPYLYDATLGIGAETLSAKVGVREIRVQGTELLLNGKPVHLFGANRVSEDPAEGLRESDAIVKRDMSDMLADNMRMMRIAHYPQAPALLDFADAHGMLIIAEVGNWNLGAWQMADQGVRTLWQKQMLEMMQQDWNHPSVIAWSMGNEFESATPQGIDWVRDMRAYTLGLDRTRLITFASRFTGYPEVKTGKDDASQYSDFVSVNIYGDYAKRLDRVHDLWPDKPVFMTEFGHMGEPGLHDPERIADITEAVSAMKARPWMIGGSLWTWADYRSLHRGTPPDGIRKWGTVTFTREHRDSWAVVQKLFATELP